LKDFFHGWTAGYESHPGSPPFFKPQNQPTLALTTKKSYYKTLYKGSLWGLQKTTWLGSQRGSGTNGKVCAVVLRPDQVLRANAQHTRSMVSAIYTVGLQLVLGLRLALLALQNLEPNMASSPRRSVQTPSEGPSKGVRCVVK